MSTPSSPPASTPHEEDWARANTAPGLRDAVLPGLGLWRGLLRAAGQKPLPRRYRAWVLLARIRMWALLWAIVVPLWIPLDLLLVGGTAGHRLALGRLVVTLLLIAEVWLCRCPPEVRGTRRALAVLFGTPLLYFMLIVPTLVHTPTLSATGAALIKTYQFIPLLIVASIGLLPVTVLEGLAVAGACLLATVLGRYILGDAMLSNAADLGQLWILFVAALIGILAGVSQTALLLQNFRDAVTDPLTRLHNRRAGINLLALQWQQAQRDHKPLSVALIDIDHFKRVNDTHGHAAGDRTLIDFATRLQGALRAGDALVRWGGEEFLAVLPGAASHDAAQRLKRLLHAQTWRGPGGELLTFSAGIAEQGHDAPPSPEALVALADQRMYQAKAAGRAAVLTGRAA